MNLKSENGASLVEFALILPLLLVLLFGIIEFGLFIFNKSVITNASREGARAGVVRSYPNLRISAEEITTKVQNYTASSLVNFCSDSNLTVTVEPSDPTNLPPGANLSVEVTFDYCFLLIPALTNISDSITLSATTVMRAE